MNLTIRRLFQALGYWEESDKRKYLLDIKMGFDTTTATGFKYKKKIPENSSNDNANKSADDSTSDESDEEESSEEEVDSDDEIEDNDETMEDDGDEDSEESSDESNDETERTQDNVSMNVRDYIIVTLLVPVRLKDDDTGEVLWQNPSPNSSRFCRPIRLNFTKDTNEITIEEKKSLDKEIREFLPVETPSGDVTCNFQVTMLDGKVSIYSKIIYFHTL